MNFASFQFFAFLGIVYLLYRLLPHRGQNFLLLGASYFFYGCWDWRFLGLIVLSTIVDFVVGQQLHRTESARRRKTWLLVSLVTNLGLLAVFKYFNFFADSAQEMLGTLGWEVDWRLLQIVLPVGISFYTFQTLSYTIDIYRRKLEPVKSLPDFALFVAFFPQLVAGPIERAAVFLPQVAKPRKVNFSQSADGLYLILFGLFKKVVIADGIAPSVDAVYGAPGPYATLDVVLATWLFAIQIYCDFSAYSDIARGVSKLLGFELMVNFRFPFFSTNPQEFWRRWHISLSSWLRDYLYIPLGGSRGGNAMLYRNLMLTMVLGGLWHGAAWNFVLWGFFQGGILCLHRLIVGAKPELKPVESVFDALVHFAKVVLFFQVVCYGWLLFRAESLGQVIDLSAAVFWSWDWSMPGLPTPPLAALIGVPLLVIFDFLQSRSRSENFDQPFFSRWPEFCRSAVYSLLLLTLLMGLANERSAFIYFQF
ncbi:MAG: MBOAT family O-acyltransferase [Verrucomicrobiota bacterium]